MPTHYACPRGVKPCRGAGRQAASQTRFLEVQKQLRPSHNGLCPSRAACASENAVKEPGALVASEIKHGKAFWCFSF